MYYDAMLRFLVKNTRRMFAMGDDVRNESYLERHVPITDTTTDFYESIEGHNTFSLLYS